MKRIPHSETGASLPKRRKGRKRRFYGNRYVKFSKAKSPEISTEQQKLSTKNDDHSAPEVQMEFGYVLLEFTSAFSSLASIVQCKKCGGNVSFEKDQLHDESFKLKVCCQSCQSVDIDLGPFAYAMSSE